MKQMFKYLCTVYVTMRRYFMLKCWFKKFYFQWNRNIHTVRSQ